MSNFIYNSSSTNKSSFLTKNEALKLFRSNNPNLVISGNETVTGNEVVFGNSLTTTLTVSESAVINNLTTYGSTYIGTDNLQQHRVIGELLLTKIPQLTSNINPTNEKDLTTKKYTDDKFASLTGYNTWTNANNFTSGFMVGNALTFSPSNLVFNKMPITDIDRTADIIDDKHFVVKKYCDDKFSSKTGINTHSGFNEFQGGLRVRYIFTADDSGMTFTTVPKTTSDLTHLMTDDNHFITKKYLDLGKAALIASGNDYTGENKHYHLTVPNCCGLTQANGAIFSVIPKTDLDRTLEITDDKHFVTKKFIDNKFNSSNNFGTSTTQTMFNNTVTNKFVVGYSIEAAINESAIFDYIPKTRTDKTSDILLDTHMTTKKYVDYKVANSVPLPNQFPTKFLVNQQTSYVVSGWDYILSTPKIQANGWDCYLNWKTSEGGRTFMSNTCTISVEWHYYQSKKLTGTPTDNGNGTYTYTSAPTNLNISPQFKSILEFNSAQNQNLASTKYHTKSISATYNIGTINDLVTITPVYQSTSIYDGSKGLSASSTTIVPGVPKSIKTASAYPRTVADTQVYFEANPLEFIFVNKNKVRINVKFPQLCNSPSSATYPNICAPHNNPTLDGWMSSVSCSISIVESPFQQSHTTLLSTVSSDTNLINDSGSVYFTI